MADIFQGGLLLQTTNAVAYWIFHGLNIRSIPSIFQGYIRNHKTTRFTPSPWTFAMWWIIDILLLGTVIYQFSARGKEVVVDGISWRFPILIVLTTVYLNVWTTDRSYITAFVFALLASMVTTNIYYLLRKRDGPRSPGERLLVDLPFSLYHAWTTVILVLAAFEAFGKPISDTGPSHNNRDVVPAVLGLLFLEAIAAAYAFTGKEGDLPATIVVTWSLFGVYDYQTWVGTVYWFALILAILSLVAVFKAAFDTRRRLLEHHTTTVADREREPLLDDGA